MRKRVTKIFGLHIVKHKEIERDLEPKYRDEIESSAAYGIVLDLKFLGFVHNLKVISVLHKLILERTNRTFRVTISKTKSF